MQLLSGWKEIANHLHLNVRTAQRWERLGLPVRRPYDSTCSPVLADPKEIDHWATRRQTRAAKHTLDTSRSLSQQFSELQSERRRTLRQTRRLLLQIAAAQSRQKRLLTSLKANYQTSLDTARDLRTRGI